MATIAVPEWRLPSRPWHAIRETTCRAAFTRGIRVRKFSELAGSKPAVDKKAAPSY